MNMPWRGTTEEISAEVESRYETPGGAQNKVDQGLRNLPENSVGAKQLDPSLLDRVTDIAINAKFQMLDARLADNPIKPESFFGTDFQKLQQSIAMSISQKRAIFLSRTYDIGDNTLSLSKVYSPRNPTYIFGGGTIKKSAGDGYMFDSDIVASSDYYFENITFDAGGKEYFKCHKEVDLTRAYLIRLSFSNCTFINGKHGIYSDTYLQSVYMDKCTIVNMSDDFIKVNGAINCHFTNNTFEDCVGSFINHTGINRGQAVGLRLLSNVSIQDNVLEGLNNASKPVLNLKGTNGLYVAGNYFEKNPGGHIVFDPGTTTFNVCIEHNNHFGSSDATALIVWGRDLVKCFSSNNSSSIIPVHDTRNIVTGKVIGMNDQSPVANLETNTKFLFRMDENLILKQEGTFTPTIGGSITAGTNSYATQSGVYKRQGDLVTCDISLILKSPLGTMTGDLEISGLPFPILSVNPTYFPSASIAGFANITLTAGYTQLGAWGVPNTSKLVLHQSGSGLYRIKLPPSALVISSEIMLSITYRITP